MYCTNCGKKLNENSMFCPSCGKNLQKDNTPNINETNQNVKIVFFRNKEINVARIEIFIDGNRIGKIKSGESIETYVSPGTHKVHLSHFKTYTNDRYLNVSPDMKVIYVELYMVSKHPSVKSVNVERIIGNQQSNNNTYRQNINLNEENNVVIKPEKNLGAVICFISAVIGLFGLHIPFGVLGIAGGGMSLGTSEVKDSFKIFAVFGIIIGIIDIGICIFKLVG